MASSNRALIIAPVLAAAVLIGVAAVIVLQLRDAPTESPAASGVPTEAPTGATPDRTATPEPTLAAALEPLAGPATCENGTFRVYVPYGWHTLETPSGAGPGPSPLPAEGAECGLFAPEAFDDSNIGQWGSARAGPNARLEVVRGVESGSEDFGEPSDTSGISISGLSGNRLEFFGTGAEPDGRQAVEYLIELDGDEPPDSGRALSAWFTALPDDYEDHLPAFEQIVASFEMLDGTTEAARQAEVDRLFAETDTCERPDPGLVFTFPDDWYANTEYEDIAACTYFAPRLYEIEDLEAIPEGVEIVVRLAEGSVAPPGDVVVWDQRTLGLGPAARYEVVSRGDGAPAGERSYRYAIGISGELPSHASAEPYLLLETNTSIADDYPLVRSVIEEMVERIELDR